MGEKVGSVKISCDSVIELLWYISQIIYSDVKNGIPVTRYNLMTPCSKNTTIEITNMDSESKYWVIVADVDCIFMIKV